MIEMGQKEAHHQEFHLKCKVQVVNQNFTEVADGRQHETTSVLLLPDLEATETSRFLNAWLPDLGVICLNCQEDVVMGTVKCPKCGSNKIKTDWSECPSFIGHPVHGPCRMAVMRKNNYCKQHHLFVMSSGVESDLRNMDGKTIGVHIFPADQDNICDNAADINRTRI